jgi:ABC-type molybdate transport system substrate-binding protein
VTGLVLVAVAAVLLIVTSSGSKPSPTSSTPTTNVPTSQHRAKANAFNPSTVSVAVLNGTATAGLAAKVMTQLAQSGYKQGTNPTNAANQTHATTVVAYMAGHRADALQVAKSLKLSSAAVQPIDAGTQALACPQPTSCGVDVVVTVGQDLAGG